MIKQLGLFLATVPLLALNYSIAGAGPHHVVTGRYMFFNVAGTILSGSDEPVTPVITGVPAGATVTYPNILAVCCTTYAPGIAGNNIVKVDATGVAVGTYPLTITFTSNTTSVVKTASWNLIVDPVPIAPPIPTSYPVDIPLSGFAQWQANMVTYGHFYSASPLGCPAYEGFVWYYDGCRNYYQIQDYTHDVQWRAIAIALSQCYQAYVTTNAGMIPGYHVFPRGLAMGYTRDGLTANRTALISMQTSGYSNPTNLAPTIDWLLSREISYGIETNVEAEGLGIARGAKFQDIVEILFGHFDQWFLTGSAGYKQPFMVALACEALIKYGEIVPTDTRVFPMIKLAADSIWNTSFDSGSTSFLYYNYDAMAGPPPTAPYPNDAMCSNYASFSVTCQGPSPDLNLLILPIYGWVYEKTADVAYRAKGDLLFNMGTSNTGFLSTGKLFSQNYRWSGDYIRSRAPIALQLQPSTPVLNNFSSTVKGVTFGNTNASPHCYFWSQIPPPYRIELVCYTDASTVDPLQVSISGNMIGDWHFSGGDVTWIFTKNNVTGLIDYQIAAALTGQSQVRFTGSF